jgi:hypothetical protein
MESILKRIKVHIDSLKFLKKKKKMADAGSRVAGLLEDEKI